MESPGTEMLDGNEVAKGGGVAIRIPQQTKKKPCLTDEGGRGSRTPTLKMPNGRVDDTNRKQEMKGKRILLRLDLLYFRNNLQHRTQNISENNPDDFYTIRMTWSRPVYFKHLHIYI